MKLDAILATPTPAPSLAEKIPIALVGLDHPNTKSLLQHLLNHPRFVLQNIYQPGKAKWELQKAFPEFQQHRPIWVKPFHLKDVIQKHQVVIMGLKPSAKSNNLFAPLRKSGLKILDLMGHTAHEFKPAIGLGEIFSQDMQQNHVVSAPHPAIIPVILALAPFLQTQSIATDKIIVDIKTSPQQYGNSIAFLDLHNTILQKPEYVAHYKPQMLACLQMLSKEPVHCLVQHTLLPIPSGIHVTVVVKPFRKPRAENFHETLKHFYHHYPFVVELPLGASANLKDVVNTNQCQISLFEDLPSESLIITAVVDENQKATSGNAIQCLNTMFDLPTTAGL